MGAQPGGAAVAEVAARSGASAAGTAESSTTSPAGGATTPASASSPRPPEPRRPRHDVQGRAAALHSGLAHSLVILLRAMGTPRQVFRKLPRAVAKFCTTSTMEVVESGDVGDHPLRLHAGYAHSRLDCLYAQGLLSAVPTIFGLPRRASCTTSASPTASGLRLPPDLGRRPGPRRRRRPHARGPELDALRGQLPDPAVGGYRPRRQRRRRHRARPHRRPGRRGRLAPPTCSPSRTGRRRPAGAQRRVPDGRRRRPWPRRSSTTGPGPGCAVVVDVASARRAQPAGRASTGGNGVMGDETRCSPRTPATPPPRWT